MPLLKGSKMKKAKRNNANIAVVGLLGLLAMAGLCYVNSADGSSDDVLILTDKNTVSLALPINGESVKDVQQSLLNISYASSRSAPIYLVLNSPGGSIDDGRHLIDTAKALPQKVSTISMFSASMSFIIAQYLGERYVLEDSTIMAHRATASGMEGQIPGSLLSRVLALLEALTEVEEVVASRAKISLDQYHTLTANELWMSGKSAVQLGFADKIVRVRCDSSLNGPGASRTIDLGFVQVDVQFHKCPLITSPINIKVHGDLSSVTAQAQKKAFFESIYNRQQYVKDYGNSLVIK